MRCRIAFILSITITSLLVSKAAAIVLEGLKPNPQSFTESYEIVRKTAENTLDKTQAAF